MGIVNTTPDSFSDGGKYISANKAIDFAYDLLDKGANIIDIGGESSRPGAEPISSEEEIKRISPKAGRFVYFSGDIPHCASRPVENLKRMVININMSKE